MRATLKVLGAALLLALAASAAAPPTRQPAPTREADQLDYVFLGSDQPVRIRLHVRCGERPYDAVWADWMDKVFAWFDRNGDGVLGPDEARRLPQGNALSSQLQGAIGGGGGASVSLNQLDTNKDGLVSKAEFKAFYRNNGVRPLQFVYNNQPATQAKQVNDAIYKRLDRDGDGKLTEEEVARLPHLLGPLDENEDELLTANELNTTSNPGMYGFAVRLRGGRGQGTMPEQSLIEVPDAPGAGKQLAGQVARKYDADKNGKLTQKEVGLGDEAFGRLDRNKDGVLDAAELEAWFAGEPDLVLRLRVGQVGAFVRALRSVGLGEMGKSVRVDRAEVFNPKNRPMPLAARVKKVNNDNLTFTLGDTRFQVQGTQGQVNSFNNGVKDFYLQQFSALADKKGYVARAQEKESRQNPFVFQIFTQADKNADDKLTREELVGWLDLMGEGQNAYVTMNVEDMGRGLFEVLDADGSTQLSIREMRTAWQRLQPLARDGKGLAVSDLPRTLRIVAGQGNTGFQPQVIVFGGGPQPQKAAPAGDAPLWFRKMDRNHDGDVSPKEWLGTEDEFRAVDADSDGLIGGRAKFEARGGGRRRVVTLRAARKWPVFPTAYFVRGSSRPRCRMRCSVYLLLLLLLTPAVWLHRRRRGRGVARTRRWTFSTACRPAGRLLAGVRRAGAARRLAVAHRPGAGPAALAGPAHLDTEAWRSCWSWTSPAAWASANFSRRRGGQPARRRQADLPRLRRGAARGPGRAGHVRHPAGGDLPADAQPRHAPAHARRRGGARRARRVGDEPVRRGRGWGWPGCAARPRRKVLVLLTDGEHNQSQTRSGWTPRQAAQVAASLGVPVYAIDTGAEADPSDDAARVARGVAIATLQDIGKVAPGRYFAARDARALAAACRAIDRLERTRSPAISTGGIMKRTRGWRWPRSSGSRRRLAAGADLAATAVTP
ncbi:MAG: hypothetical protein U0797_17050 [Gemmataceae bacterium]